MNDLDLWGIAAIGDTFVCFGILSLIFSYNTKRVCFDATLCLASAEK